MTQHHNDEWRLRDEIAALRQAIDTLAALPAAQAPLQAQLAEKEAALTALHGTPAGPHVDQPRANRDLYIATQQTINTFFGGEPGEDGQTLLSAYLDSLSDDCQRLRLNRLTGKRQSGSEQRSQADGLRLEDVYTSLTTNGVALPRLSTQARADRIRRFLERIERSRRTPDDVAPERVITVVLDQTAGQANRAPTNERLLDAVVRHMGLDPVTDETVVSLSLTRPELALEAIRAERRLVLLGEPGAGKSTALRYLALLLAQRLRGTQLRIPGWPTDDTPVPVVLPLGQVAAALRAGAADAYAALLQVLGDVLEAGVRLGLRRFLTPALREGGVLLLCDGLDELPATASDGSLPPRVAVAAALRRLARETRARMVVTSRVLPYRAEGDWKLLPEDGWALRTVQPLAFGQTCAFVRSWYAALGLSDPDLAGRKAAEKADNLIAELGQSERLRPLVRSPLLLTMLAILHYNIGDVPRDRARLYEECVELLLDRWEPQRQPDMPRESLIQRLDLPSLDPLRRVLHELAYQAQLQPPGDDGRGLIGGEALTQRMFTFFKQLGSLADADTRTTRFLGILDSEDSGLLQRRGDEGYALPHLTFQEYLAACHLADRPKMLEEAYPRWCGADRERWREVLLLLMGRLSQQGKAEEKGLPWLRLLAGAKLGKVMKDDSQRRQDAVLAALSYVELRERGAFAGSMLDIEADLETPLRGAITPLLEVPDSAVAPIDRIAAARVLGELGDPRFPVHLDAWQHALAQRGTTLTGEGDHYWRYVPGGRYQIGGWGEGEPSAELDLAPFWATRLPITVAQFTAFLEAGAYRDQRWWTPEGWKYHQNDAQPKYWGETGRHEPNQPVTIITWYDATAYCAWLSAQLSEQVPVGYVLRLPTDAEWEATAAYAGPGVRRSYPWGEDDPSPELAIYDALGLDVAAPVGCCPTGAAACGALDLAGNVWEWTSSSYRGYPEQAHDFQKDFTTDKWDVPLRGSSYRNSSLSVRCGARNWYFPLLRNVNPGFRVFVAPRITH